MTAKKTVKKNVYVLSCLENDQLIELFDGKAEIVANKFVRARKILILGKQAIARGENMIQSKEIAGTEISSDDLALLEKEPSFKRWVEKKFIVVSDSDGMSDIKLKGKELTGLDKSRKLTKDEPRKSLKGKQAKDLKIKFSGEDDEE